jgi:putative transposase
MVNPTDLADADWERIRPLLPRPARRGRKPAVNLREVLNAIRYLGWSGVGWSKLPHDLPPWQTVYWWFRRFVRRLLFRTLHDVALMLDRAGAGREGSPSAGVSDSQAVTPPHAPGGGGYDAAKRAKSRKRHVVVDADGRLLMVNLTSADMQDAAGAEAIVKAMRQRWPWLKHLFADGAYHRGRLVSAAAYRDFVVAVVRNLEGLRVSRLSARRQPADRTFGRIGRWRRLVRDYERRCDVSEIMARRTIEALLLRCML